MKHSTILLLKASLTVISLIVLALCIFWLPGQAAYFAETAPEFSHLHYPVLIGLYLTAIPFFFALYQAFIIITFIEKNKAFSGASVRALKYIKYCALTIVLLYLIGIIYLISQSAGHPGIVLMGLIIIFSSVVISVFTTVLQKLIQNALKIQAENDLTV
jgi:hypothetical protein